MAVLKRCPRNKWLLRRLFARAICGVLATVSVCGSQSVSAQEQPLHQWQIVNTSVDVSNSEERQAMRMVVSTSREITANQPFKSIRIQNPDILSVLPLEGGNRLQLSALTTGITQVDLLGADESVHSIEVMVLGDVRELEAILRGLFPDANLQVVPVQQGCIVSGFVTSDDHVEEVMEIAELYFPTVINKVNVTGVYTIQLETQIMEISRTKLRELGIDWAFANGDDFIKQSVGGIVSNASGAISTTGIETFQLGVIENSSTFFTAVRALRKNNLVKVLASPTLTAVDGRPASFNAGGEIPILIPAGLGQVAVQFREFGTRLDYVAKVRGNGRIWLEVRPYVSEIDPSRSVVINGTSVPGLRSRFLETGVEMGAGQTLALAGLLQVKSETVNLGLPVLSDIPYVGALFRTTREEQNEIELLITVTPNFAGPMDPHEVPSMAPGMFSQPPTDKELYWKGYVETPVGGNAQCPPEAGNFVPNQNYIDPQPGYYQEATPPQYMNAPTDGGYNTPSAPLPTVTPNAAAMNNSTSTPKLARQPVTTNLPPAQAPQAGGQSQNQQYLESYPTGGVVR
ncbi:type II and III secretion system protein family protein [Aureliella helgolandensis]|uniref:Type II secretion system protein D n=1 Tax=Aureliella helgolandensis TaxID=2527968 RepID=A0A518G2L7_9BACT|nr:pilus assembly protein N-terminal domain-containing protein [Aureliella helgolandensis]QDV22834.1 Type II secretion system protein D precursor [Aureliella helgolandensis]